MQAPLHVIHHKRFRHPRGVGFQETPQRVRQEFVEVCRPAFLHIHLRPLGQLGRQFSLDHGSIHRWKLARPPHVRKDNSGTGFERLKARWIDNHKERKDPKSKSSLRSLRSLWFNPQNPELDHRNVHKLLKNSKPPGTSPTCRCGKLGDWFSPPPSHPSPPATPQNLTIKTGPHAGAITVKVQPVPLADSYGLQTAVDPAGPWSPFITFTNSWKMIKEGLTRGQDVYSRVRAISSNGTSEWADIAVVMVV